MTDRDPDPDDGREDPELAVLVEELSATLETLQDTFDRPAGGRRVGPPGPPGPAPPSPRELLRFTERYTIPTLIALLESGVRSLELLRATLRLLDGRGMERASPATRERVEAVGRTTLDRVDRALSELGSAVEGEPTDPDARNLLADARALRDEIDARLREAESGTATRDRDRDTRRTAARDSTSRQIPVRSAGESDTDEERDEDGEGDDGDVPVDVDAELESIREDVAREGRERVAGHEEDGDEDEPGDGDEHEG